MQKAVDVAPVEPVVEAKKVIVIDAGHGGKDPGAHGASHLEKDVTLAAARALRDRLEATGRYKVVLTRDTDVFVPLETRPQIARRANADLFISLHADAAGGESSSDTRGASVYTLSEHGVDRVQKGVFGHSDWFMNVNMPGQDAATKRILLDLTQRQTVNRSSTFAETLLEHIGTATDLLHRSHRDAGLMVLLAPGGAGGASGNGLHHQPRRRARAWRSGTPAQGDGRGGGRHRCVFRIRGQIRASLKPEPEA